MALAIAAKSKVGELGGTRGARPRERTRFETTRWEVVLRARTAERKAALSALCAAYWYPVYAFLRGLGTGPLDARDVTQGFFAFVIERNDLATIDPTRGRFRNWLRASAKNFLRNELKRFKAKKRGGGKVPVSIDAATAEERERLEPIDRALSAEQRFDCAWALTVVGRSYAALRTLYEGRGAGTEFALLVRSLTGARNAATDAELGLLFARSAGAMKVARHRGSGVYAKLEQTYLKCLRAEIGQTVVVAAAIHAEIVDLIGIIDDLA